MERDKNKTTAKKKPPAGGFSLPSAELYFPGPQRYMQICVWANKAVRMIITQSQMFDFFFISANLFVLGAAEYAAY